MTIKIKLLFAAAFLIGALFSGCSDSKKTGITDSGQNKTHLQVKVEGSGMDPVKLAEIPVKMQQFVDEKQSAGIVTLVAHNGQIVSWEAVGLQNIEKEILMQRNTLFRIASMTKPFAAAAIMMLSEEGKLHLDDPVEKYLPEFSDMWLLSEITKDKSVLVRPARSVTIRDILTHTSGLGSLPGNIPVKSIAEYVYIISQRPLQFEPGSQFRYSGAGITTAARIVEILSGKSYDVFLAERIFKPLGMTDTYFLPPEESAFRIASVYKPSADGELEDISNGPEYSELPVNSIEHPDWHNFPRPEGGLFSTAGDMYIWMQTIVNKGILNGHRILTEESVFEITKAQTDEFADGLSYGLGFRIITTPIDVTAMFSPGSFGHGGAFGTQYWADPLNNTIYIVMIQRRGFPGGDSHEIRRTLQEIAFDAIMD